MMEIFGLFPVTVFVILSVAYTVLCVDHTCQPVSCGTGPQVRFPFRFDKQPTQCGYQDFELSCNNQSQVVLKLNLPSIGDPVVNDINYSLQTIYLKPDFCVGSGARFFDTLATPFTSSSPVEYTFFNCSPSPFFPILEPFELLDCLSSVNNTVVAGPTSSLNASSFQDSPESCQSLNFSIPVAFVWDLPSCGRCERENTTCGYKNFESLKVGCSVSSKSGLSTAAKYGIIVGTGLPALVLLACLTIYARKKIKERALIQQEHNVRNLPTATRTPQPPPMYVVGLVALTNSPRTRIQ